MRILHCVLLVLAAWTTSHVYAVLAPVWIDDMNQFTISESTKVGTIVYTLKAVDPEGAPVTYTMTSDYLGVNEATGEVTLLKKVDHRLSFADTNIRIAAHDNETTNSIFITINIYDDNDKAPKLQRERLKFNVTENASPGHMVVSDLKATDEDSRGQRIEVICNPTPPVVGTNLDPDSFDLYKLSCETFQVIEDPDRISNNKEWFGGIRLQRRIDFETQKSYQLPLQLFDGLNTKVQSVIIDVLNENDSPPTFIYSAGATIKENLPAGTSITYVIAIDGDREDKRPIVYDLSCSDATGNSLFEVNRTSGVIETKAVLDRESDVWSTGFTSICVKAREMLNATTPGFDVTTTATVALTINLQDVNDNGPRFHRDNFTVYIRENIIDQTALPNLALTVSDRDGPDFDSFTLTLEDFRDIFEVFPDRGETEINPGVKVINSSKINYETGPRLYVLRLVARDVHGGNPDPRSSVATINVHILDVNDNAPSFSQPDYYRTVSETANIGTTVIDARSLGVTDPDTNLFGVQGLVFELFGNEADKFYINRQTGTVTIADCQPKPGVSDCIDYEDKQRFELTIRAKDNEGRGFHFTTEAKLIITVTDVNDNAPVFTTNQYVGSIFEGETRTTVELYATATDRDTEGGPVTYTILESQDIPGATLWQIDRLSGLITATRPVLYSDTLDRGVFNLTVFANDLVHTTLVPVTINVIDVNGFDPKFEADDYQASIPESTLGDHYVLSVLATDEDSPTSANGQIEYNIEAGAQGKFVIDKVTGNVTTASDATFDYDLQRRYNMQILARDKGTTQRTGTTSLTVFILDANNKDPYFVPFTRRTEILENAGIGAFVVTVTARDPDDNANVRYRFVEPIRAITPGGIDVNRNNYNFPDLFRVDEVNGQVRTNGILDRDQASVVYYTVVAVDTAANPPQTGTGTLIINILEYNDQNPYFTLPLYNITIEEEQPIGAFVKVLVAQDEDDQIARYELYNLENNYFAVDQSTGVLTIRNNIDYEKVQKITFNARATDTGAPPLSNTTRIIVNIKNINDNSPLFEETAYTANVPEHSALNTSVVRVRANDSDLGDFGVVRYRLDNSEDRFVIDAESGIITVNKDLDREIQPSISIQVTAFDSPLDTSLSREYTVPVYINLIDINDNSPVFASDEYEAKIIETVDVGAQVIIITATDEDADHNADIVYSIIRPEGDAGQYYGIGLQTGRITTTRSLIGKSGVYVFHVLAQDRLGDAEARNKTAKVTVHVLKATNSPPTWTIPPRDNMTIEVLESQYLGMLVYDVHAVDDDNDTSGIVQYSFSYNGQMTQRTPEFSINKVTGVIRAEILYDRERVTDYDLMLIAQDGGDPPLRAIRFIKIVVLDVNDNVPKFPMSDGETVPYNFRINETDPVGTTVGRVQANDSDTIGLIYYKAIAGDTDTFHVTPLTGEVRSKVSLERVRIPLYTIEIQATNNITDFSVKTERKKRSTDPSIVTVRIAVTDINNEAPIFTGFNGPNQAKEYYGCISSVAPFGKSIVRVAATDNDVSGLLGITFSLTSGNDKRIFDIEPRGGVVYNRDLVDKLDSNVALMKVTATDVGNMKTTADVKVFVTSSTNEARIEINQKSSEVRNFIQQLIRLLESELDIQYVCVTLVRDHVTAGGFVDSSKTDVYVAAATGAGTNYRVYTTAELITIIETARIVRKSSYDSLYISGVGTQSEQKSLLENTPVLAVLIIIILLIIMAIILFCLACYCIRDAKRRKMRKTNAERFTIVEHEAVKVGGPIYDNQAFEREQMPIPQQSIHVEEDSYAVVQKKRPPSDEAVPVVLPAPVLVQQTTFVSSEVPEGPVPVIETVVMDDDSQVQTQTFEPEPVIVTEVVQESEPTQTVYRIPEQDPEPHPVQMVYVADPEPVQMVYVADREPVQTVYVADPEPVQTVYIADPEPVQTVYVADPEPFHTEYVSDPEPVQMIYVSDPESPVQLVEDHDENIMVEIRDDSPHSSGPPSLKYSPPPSPRHSPIPPTFGQYEQEETAML